MSLRALTELLRGKGAHVDPLACVEDMSAEFAARQVAGFPHSIGQLVFHINYWMDYELRRVRGERPVYPEHNAESFPAAAAVDAEEWERLRKNLARLLADFAALAQSSSAELQRQIETVHEGDTKVAGTLEAVLWQMVAHNSYHWDRSLSSDAYTVLGRRVAAGIVGNPSWVVRCRSLALAGNSLLPNCVRIEL